MAKLADQIQALHRKQAVMNLYLRAVENLKLLNDSEHEGVAEEVRESIGKFISIKVAQLDGEAPAPGAEAECEPLSAQEIGILRQQIARMNAAAEAPTPQGPAPILATPLPKQINTVSSSIKDKQERAQFALANRHLAEKRVRVRTVNGDVDGIVLKLDCPNAIVALDTGYTVPFEVSQLTVL